MKTNTFFMVVNTFFKKTIEKRWVNRSALKSQKVNKHSFKNHKKYFWCGIKIVLAIKNYQLTTKNYPLRTTDYLHCIGVAFLRNAEIELVL